MPLAMWLAVTAVIDLDESHLAMACITDALFCSEVEAGNVLTGAQVAEAISAALKAHRDWNGLTRAVRAAFAEAPEEAASRERWCQQVAEAALGWADIVLDCGDLPA
ncbi:hypothetical protein ABIA35_009826 [Catenulispora sp. MAP12-49]|uniref:hypothetical protein n=1 Tax=unclassified Catenulispora TaxID=414885 RepID=UPI0035196A1F